MNFPLTREKCESLLWLLTLLFPALLPLKHGVSSVFYIMALLSIVMLFQSRPRLNHIAKYMLAGFMVLILISLLSLVNAGDVENGIRRIKKLATFILFIPIFMALISVRKDLIKPYWIGACIGGFVLLGVTIYQENYLGYGKVLGFYNPIMFGTLAVVIALSLLSSVLLIEEKLIHRLVILLSLVGALFAAIQSEARGAWLGFMVCVPLVLGVSLLIKEIPKKRTLLVLTASILLASIAGLLSKDAITTRWNVTIQSMDLRQAVRDENNSIGLRLIMWDAAIKIWYRHPIIGTGIGDFPKEFERMIKNGEAGFPDVKMAPYTYAHSIFFEALACTGILGFGAIIVSTFILPIVFFLKSLKTSVKENDRYAAVFGVVFVTAFMTFGLTENWLAHKQLIMTFSLLLAIMASHFGSKTR